MTVESNLWFPPASPSAFDEEFNVGTSLDADWQYEDGAAVASISGSDVDLTAAFGAGDLRVNHNSQRLDWLYLQPPGDNVVHRVARDFTAGVELPNGTYWVRCLTRYRFGSLGTNNDSEMGLAIGRTVSGVMDDDNSVRLFLSEVDPGTILPQCQVHNNSGAASNIVEMSDHEGQGVHHEYLALVKTSNVFECFVGSGPGNWIRITSQTYTGGFTLDRVGLIFRNAQTGAPGNMILGVDFFRYRSDSQLP